MPLNIYEEMKLTAIAATEQARLLRRWERKAQAASLKAQESQKKYDKHDSFAARCQSQRAVVRKESRLLHLARAFVKGQPYKEVEASVREGNEMDPISLLMVLKIWGVWGEPEVLQRWLEAA